LTLDGARSPYREASMAGIRYIPLDNTALAAFVTLWARNDGSGPVMMPAESGHGYKAAHARL
jgi:hypothetical protein